MGGVTESQEFWFICSWCVSCWRNLFPYCGLNDWHMRTCSRYISIRPHISIRLQISQFSFQDTRVLLRILRLCQLPFHLVFYKRHFTKHFSELTLVLLRKKKIFVCLSFAWFSHSTQPPNFHYMFRKQTSDRVGDTISVISVKDCCWFPDNYYRLSMNVTRFSLAVLHMESTQIFAVVSERERMHFVN